MSTKSVAPNMYRCRLCLGQTKTKVDIFREDFPKMIEILTSTKVTLYDGLPNTSCIKCAHDVKAAMITRKRIIKSYKTLIGEVKPGNDTFQPFKRYLEPGNGTFQPFKRYLEPSVRQNNRPVTQYQFKKFDRNASPEPNKRIEFISVNEDAHKNSKVENENTSKEQDCLQIEEKLSNSVIVKSESLDSDIEFIDVQVVKSTPEQEKPEDELYDTNVQKNILEEAKKVEQNIVRKVGEISIKKVTEPVYKTLSVHPKTRPIITNLEVIRRRMRERKAQALLDTKTLLALGRKHREKKPPLSCNECHIKFQSRQAYTIHMNKHKKSKCDICGSVVRTDNFKKHMSLHSSVPVNCPLCGVICKNNDSLRGHTFYYHKNTADSYVCDECGKPFRAKYKFLLHKKKEHGGERTFKCETCGKAFFTNVNLKTHVNMTHKKLRPHICEYCGKGFSGKYALKTHVRQHTNEAPYACDFCSEGFRQKVSLRAHLKSKHGIQEENKFFCTDCNKGFTTDYALKIHKRLHLMKKCEICSESFAEDAYLANHMKEVHSNSSNTEENQELDTNLNTEQVVG